MEKTFSDGIMNGLAALTPPVPEDMLLHSDDYRKGFICGFSHALEKRCNNVTIAHYRAGQLTFKYRLSQEQLSEFFIDAAENSPSPAFIDGYRNAKSFPVS
ncbi:Protein of uncharacterised function (DUF2623) [Leminorella richardii]|uniref:Protein of uncharacterized function (DUF2623) n=1 Tax=Leminorella richardii TaxID=158841 RepID=A0A2X4UMW5_9GAMM|nr:DUF2623 family protein [Leminorella richardii]SQI40071.1 Protein of uncharacterised function (DUF2623) [Leminorella richardii]